jgi:hypothetical protein
MSRKIDFSFGAIYNTGGSPVFLGNHESIPKKDFPSRSTCFAGHFDFLSYFPGDL